MKKKLTNNIYDEKINFDNIFEMWRVIKRTCNSKERILIYSLNLNTNLMNIVDKLKDKSYIPSKYITFIIREPKARLIMNQTITDKIVNHFIANYYLIPYLESSLIDSNIATRKNKGGSYGIKLLKRYFNNLLLQKKEVYCLKVDISKYFYNIDHELLIKKIKKYIYDYDVIDLIQKCLNECGKQYVNDYIKKINREYNLDIPIYKPGKGLSIGAEASQFLAIFYLNDLDHYIKEVLKFKYYVRYMDDIIILDNDLNKIKIGFKKIEEFVKKEKLSINKKSNIYKCTNSFKFMGYKWSIYNDRLVISTNNKTYYKIRKNLKKLEYTDPIKYIKSKGSYKGYFAITKEYIGDDFKLKTKELYNLYKKKYKNTLIIIKEGIFYKTFNEDAKLIWHLFGYKYYNTSTSFGISPYNKVISKLKELDISFVMADKNSELLNLYIDNEMYEIHLKIAIHHFENNEKRQKLHKQLDELLKYSTNYSLIEEYFNSIKKPS